MVIYFYHTTLSRLVPSFQRLSFRASTATSIHYLHLAVRFIFLRDPAKASTVLGVPPKTNYNRRTAAIHAYTWRPIVNLSFIWHHAAGTDLWRPAAPEYVKA